MLLAIIATLSLLILLFLAIGVSINRQKRIDPIDRILKQELISEDETPTKDSKQKKRLTAKLSTMMFRDKSKSQKTDRSRLLLTRADVEMTSEEFLLLRLLFTAIFGFFAFALWKNPFMIALTAVAIWKAPIFYLNYKIREKCKLFDEQLLDAIGIISNSLKAGYSFFQALSAVVEETKPPLSKEFKLMLKEMSFGLSVDQAFHNLLQRIYTEDLHLMTISVLIQRDVGGNLSEILENIASTIRERQKLKGEVKTLTAQGRLSGGIVVGLPIFLGIVLYVINPAYISLLFTTGAGRIMLVLSAFSQVFGIFVISKIIKIDL